MNRFFITLILVSLSIHHLLAQNKEVNINWKQVGEARFPTMDSLWYRAKGVCGIGQVRSIASDPNNMEHLIIGTVGGGVWETYNALEENNNQVLWKSLTDSIPAYMIPKVVFLNGTIYASTTSNISTKYTSSLLEKYGLGIIKKEKKKDWEISSTKFSAGDFSVVEKDGIVTLFATGYNSQDLYKSSDNGKTWSMITSLKPLIKENDLKFGRLIIHPNDPNTVYLTTDGHKQLLFKSIDGGQSWTDKTAIITELINHDFNKKGASLELFVNPTNNSLHIAIHTKYRVFIIRSDDWDTFELYNKENKKGLYVSSMRNTALLQFRADSYLFGATHIHRLDDGSTFKDISKNKIHDDIRALEMVYNKTTKDSIVYIGNDGGIFYTKDFGKTYVNISGNLQLFQSASMAYNRQDGHRIITIGVQDGTWYRLDRDGDNRWDLIETCCEGAVYTQPDDSETIYFVKNGYLHRSTNGLIVNEKSHTLKTKKIERIEDLDAPIAIDPNNTGTIIYAKYDWPNSKLMLSYDKGEHASVIGFKENKNHMFGRPSAMSFCKNNSHVFYMASIHFTVNPEGGFFVKNYIHKSSNMHDAPEDISFINLTENLRTCDPDVMDVEPITDIYVHPDNPDKVWLCFGNLQDRKKIYTSNNGGETWRNISYNLPNAPVNDIIFDSNSNSLFIGTDRGVYILKDKKWKIYGKGLPIAMISDLEIDPVSNELIACTFGKSIWVAEMEKPCEDVIISKRTTWKTNKTICGNIIIKNGARLKIKKANVSAKCLDIQNGKLKLRRKGKLKLTCK